MEGAEDEDLQGRKEMGGKVLGRGTSSVRTTLRETKGGCLKQS